MIFAPRHAAWLSTFSGIWHTNVIGWRALTIISEGTMRGLLLAGLGAVLGCIMPLSAYAATNYKLVKTIDLPGDKGGHGDWTTYDPQTKLVWLSQSPDHNVVVIDTAKNSIAHVIEG